MWPIDIMNKLRKIFSDTEYIHDKAVNTPTADSVADKIITIDGRIVTSELKCSPNDSTVGTTLTMDGTPVTFLSAISTDILVLGFALEYTSTAGQQMVRVEVLENTTERGVAHTGMKDNDVNRTQYLPFAIPVYISSSGNPDVKVRAYIQAGDNTSLNVHMYYCELS